MENQEIINKTHSKFWLGLFLCIIIFGSGIFVGKFWQIKSDLLNSSGNVEITKLINLYSKSRSDSVSFNQFWEVWNKVKDKYVEQPVDEVKMFYGAVEGMVAGLGDPYSVYFPPQKAEEFARDLAGEFEGIGAEIGLKDKQLTVIAPLPSSPAEKAGLKPGDAIYMIDGQDTFGITLDEAIAKIRGPKGTVVVLKVGRGSAFQEIKITRDKINVPTVDWRIEKNNIVYLHVSYFNENTWREFDQAVNEIILKNPKGLILDMRSNPGGYLDTSVQVASEWIDKGVIVKEKFNDGKINEYQTEGQHRFLGMKTLVLVDEGTASGSEIVAGALQDYGKAKLMGVKTYGKGSVQDFEVLSDGSALKITIAKWFTPKDRQISEKGIEPDIKLEKMVGETKKNNGEIEYTDLGLEKALEELSK